MCRSRLKIPLLRVTGRLAAAKGKQKKAIRYFDKAIESAQKLGADNQHARALIDKSMLDHPSAQADRAKGLQMLEELGCVLPVAEQQYLGITMPMPTTDNSESNEAEARSE